MQATMERTNATTDDHTQKTLNTATGGIAARPMGTARGLTPPRCFA
jgi:hypothetical protein